MTAPRRVMNGDATRWMCLRQHSREPNNNASQWWMAVREAVSAIACFLFPASANIMTQIIAPLLHCPYYCAPALLFQSQRICAKRPGRNALCAPHLVNIQRERIAKSMSLICKLPLLVTCHNKSKKLAAKFFFLQSRSWSEKNSCSLYNLRCCS